MSSLNTITQGLQNLEIDQKISIYDLAQKYPPRGWEEIFRELAPELKTVSDQIAEYESKGAVTYPRRMDIFKAFELTSPKTIKIVILGQDSYHSTESNGEPTAMGLAFSVRPGVKIPPSLANIYKELKREYPDYQIPKHGDLSYWVTQGVFLLNASLTVEAGKAGSHGTIWTPFIKKILCKIAEINQHIIYVFWGNPAQKMIKCIAKDSAILTSSHPSPLSVNKTTTPFAGNNHFMLINQRLRELGQKEIDWQI
jgi:uracil-DNA glycosylase